MQLTCRHAEPYLRLSLVKVVDWRQVSVLGVPRKTRPVNSKIQHAGRNSLQRVGPKPRALFTTPYVRQYIKKGTQPVDVAFFHFIIKQCALDVIRVRYTFQAIVLVKLPVHLFVWFGVLVSFLCFSFVFGVPNFFILIFNIDLCWYILSSEASLRYFNESLFYRCQLFFLELLLCEPFDFVSPLFRSSDYNCPVLKNDFVIKLIMFAKKMFYSFFLLICIG